MFGKSYILKKQVPFTELEPGSADWKIYWAAFPEQQEAMLSWKRSRERTIRTHGGSDSIAVVDACDIVIAFCPAERVHSVWPFIKHRRSHIITLSPNRKEIILLKQDGYGWSAPSTHVRAEESYFSAAERALKDKLGIKVYRGRLREIDYEQKPDAANDQEATKVYEYAVPNLTEITAATDLTSVDVRELLQADENVSIDGLFWRLLHKVVKNGDLKWQK